MESRHNHSTNVDNDYEDIERASSTHLSNSNDNLISPSSSSTPRDKYKLVCLGFTILGVTTLLPWNFFITATDYWMYKFRDATTLTYNADQVHTYERTPLQTFFESYLSIAANVPMLLSMILNSFYGQRFSQKKRLYVSLSVLFIIFGLTTTFVKVNTDDWQATFFAITMVMVVLVSFFSAIFQAAIFGIVASFPTSCMHAMVNGQAVAGLLAVIIQILSMISNAGPIMSGLWYFLASTLFLAFAIFCYWSMDNDYTRHYLIRIPTEDQLSTSLSIDIIENRSEIVETIKECWHLGATVIVAFWASLAVYPAVCVLVAPEFPNTSVFTGRFFTPITTFFLFNCGDLAGRMCSTYIPFPVHQRKTLLSISLLRAIIPILILFCNVHPRNHSPVLFTNDLYFPILNTLSAFTNGYLFSSAMIMASLSSSKNRMELIGFVMASALGIGLTLGSVTSNILLRII